MCRRNLLADVFLADRRYRTAVSALHHAESKGRLTGSSTVSSLRAAVSVGEFEEERMAVRARVTATTSADSEVRAGLQRGSWIG